MSSEWGPQKAGRVFVFDRMDGSHLRTLGDIVESVQHEKRYNIRIRNPISGTSAVGLGCLL